MYTPTLDFTINVSGGTGSASITLVGVVKQISIVAPSGTATYDWYISDSGSNGITGRTASVGTVTTVEDAFCTSSATFTFINATNGTYTVRIYQLNY